MPAYLICPSSGARHDDGPLPGTHSRLRTDHSLPVAVATCGHSRDVEALPPFLLDPLKGEDVGHLVRLLREASPLGHDCQGVPVLGACTHETLSCT